MEWKLSRRTQQRFRHFRVWKEFEQKDESPENYLYFTLKRASHPIGFLKPSYSIF